MTEHYQRLENMYHSSPIHAFYESTLKVTKGEASISLPMRNTFHHTAGSIHGSVYFKLLDDAAYFSVSSLETEYFIYTSQFQVYFLRPVKTGIILAHGKVLHISRRQFIAESIVYDEREKELARGLGTFMKSDIKLTKETGYL